MSITETNETTSVGESIKISVIAGMAEILVNHPLWVLKTRRQCEYPFSLKPSVLYKGIVHHAYSEVMLAILQITCSIQIEEQLKKTSLFQNKNKFPIEKMTSAFLGGGLSALIASPTELIMTQQQKRLKESISNSTETRFPKIALDISKKKGMSKLFLGIPCVAARESLYVCGFFMGTSKIGESINQHIHNRLFASMMAGITAGVLSSIITQPFDTVKSIQQDTVFEESPLTALKTTKKLYQQSGFRGFFKGIVERSVRIGSATAIIGTVIEHMRPTF